MWQNKSTFRSSIRGAQTCKEVRCVFPLAQEDMLSHTKPFYRIAFFNVRSMMFIREGLFGIPIPGLKLLCLLPL